MFNKPWTKKSILSSPWKEKFLNANNFINERRKRAIARRSCEKLVDLGVIIDGSSSIGESNFRAFKSFTAEFFGNFVINPDKTRISVIKSSTSPFMEIPFHRSFDDHLELERTVRGIDYRGGSSYLGAALSKARDEMFQASNGARTSLGAKKVLLVITDGLSIDSVIQPAQNLRNDGVVIHVIGVGSSLSTRKIHWMASLPKNDHMYLLNNSVEALLSKAQEIATKACNANSYYLTCGQNNMTLTFSLTLVQTLDLDNMVLNDGICKASYNATHVFVTAPLSGCGTLFTQTTQEMFFTNNLSVPLRPSRGSVITRSQKLNFTFTCTYDRLISVSGVKFQPPSPVVVINEGASGDFVLELGSFSNNDFSSSSSDQYPVFKSIRDRIYIQYSIDTANSNIVVRAESCHATPTNKAYNQPQYQIIKDSCDKDSTITHHTSGLRKLHQFSMQVFRFLTNHTLVYIHCDIRLCDKNDPNSVCARNAPCTDLPRKRRNVEQNVDINRSFPVSVGPFTLQKEPTVSPNAVSNNGCKGNDDDNKMIIFILVGVIVMVIVLATIIFLFLYLSRRTKRSPDNATKPAPHVPSYGNDGLENN
ncbi:CUB and zona pellucida-like domain-containing protein 1 [Xenia sp. Carnegie-2017]|uniref:CUB and zona pellucida-like domain-containing protein 1 n=1 Tax=Xenia sp. Carnegie-2017 TaxID=2897299 RepID=UPI001F04D291|nr:CUB and zona pellucida-like domain-containing protein 1 [Xenia sp. Carnegie-2017]